MKAWKSEEIIELAIQGYSASSIRGSLGLSVSVRQIQRIMQPYRPARQKAPERVHGDRLHNSMHDICEQLMIEKGMNPKICSLCGLPQFKKCDIHHTKYEGATLDDLLFVCRKCNNAPANVGLI